MREFISYEMGDNKGVDSQTLERADRTMVSFAAREPAPATGSALLHPRRHDWRGICGSCTPVRGTNDFCTTILCSGHIGRYTGSGITKF
jgi:hypothetical protein